MPQGARTSGERGGLILGVPAKAQLLTGRKSWAKWPSIWGRKRSSISKFFEKMQKKRPEGRFFLFYLRKTFRARRGGERFRPPGGRTVGPTVSFCKKEMVGPKAPLLEGVRSAAFGRIEKLGRAMRGIFSAWKRFCKGAASPQIDPRLAGAKGAQKAPCPGWDRALFRMRKERGKRRKV